MTTYNGLKRKHDFVERLNEAFQGPNDSTVIKVEYKAFEVPLESGEVGYYDEYIVMTYKGGAIAARIANMNSDIANLLDIARLAHGGYYDEVEAYNRHVKNFKEVVF